MLALLPILLSLAPSLISAIAGDRAGNVATQAVDLAKAITGTDDENEAAAVLASDPAKATELSVALAKISAEAKASQEAHETARLQAVLADTQSARQYSADMAKTGSWLAFGAPAVTIAILGLFTWVIVTNVDMPADIRETLKNLAIACVGYWIGSSRGSAAKDERKN